MPELTTVQQTKHRTKVGMGNNTGQQTCQTKHGGRSMLILLQHDKLDHHEEQVGPVKGPHPPDIGGRVGTDHIADRHSPGVFYLKSNDQEPSNDGRY